jgi:TRAP-type C4-dicarboxylate transport system substrate-binding protein
MRRLSWAAAFAAAALASSAALAQAPIEWRFFTYFPVNDKPAQSNRAFAEDVLKATNGRLKITVFAAGELPYRAPDVVKAVATNQIQMGDVAVGFAAGDVPELNVLSLPFLCSSYDQFDRAMESVKPVADDVFQKKFGITVAMHWTMPPQNFWLNKPVVKLEDVKGMKIRSWNPEQVEMMKLLGGSAVSITSAEVIPALERKVIDGAITSALSANDWRAYDIVKGGYMVNMTMGHQVMMINAEELAKLPTELRTTLVAKGREWAAKYRTMSETGDVEARRNLQANRVALTEPAADDVARARAMLRPLWDQWAQKHGDTGKRLLDASMKACGAS